MKVKLAQSQSSLKLLKILRSVMCISVLIAVEMEIKSHRSSEGKEN